MDKENLVCVHNKMLFSLKKTERNSAMCSNIDETVGYYTEKNLTFCSLEYSIKFSVKSWHWYWSS